jgi:hypothetical protein
MNKRAFQMLGFADQEKITESRTQTFPRVAGPIRIYIRTLSSHTEHGARTLERPSLRARELSVPQLGEH